MATTHRTGARRRRRASILIYTLLVLPVLCGICLLAVDWGHVILVRTQLQSAADAAARNAANNLGSGVTAAEDAAVSVAADNLADQTAVNLVRATDIEFGTWNPSTTPPQFTVLSGAARANANAVRVTARRTAATNNAVALSFGFAIGFPSIDVRAVATARMTLPGYGGIIGLSFIDMKNNNYIGSYLPNSVVHPSQSDSTLRGGLGSNGAIDGGNNSSIDGNIMLGPSAPSSSGITINNGQEKRLAANIPSPAMPSWSPTANPGGIPQSYSVSGNTVLAGGTYYFTSLTVSGTLTFSGPATLIINGPVNFSGRMAGYNDLPANLSIKQLGNTTFGNGNANNATLIAEIDAPGSDFEAKNNFTFQGRMLFKSITVKNNAAFFYDESLAPADGAPTAIVQ